MYDVLTCFPHRAIVHREPGRRPRPGLGTQTFVLNSLLSNTKASLPFLVQNLHCCPCLILEEGSRLTFVLSVLSERTCHGGNQQKNRKACLSGQGTLDRTSEVLNNGDGGA